MPKEDPELLLVAQKLADMVNEKDILTHSDVVHFLDKHFPKYIYENQKGNMVVDKTLLQKFKQLTPDIVWYKFSLYWKKREPGDEPGRSQPH